MIPEERLEARPWSCLCVQLQRRAMNRLLYRLGHGCARRRYLVMVLWLVAMVAALSFVGGLRREDEQQPHPARHRQPGGVRHPGGAVPAAAERHQPVGVPRRAGQAHRPAAPARDERRRTARSRRARTSTACVNPLGKNGKTAGILSEGRARSGSCRCCSTSTPGFITDDLAQRDAGRDHARAQGRHRGRRRAGRSARVLSSPDTKHERAPRQRRRDGDPHAGVRQPGRDGPADRHRDRRAVDLDSRSIGLLGHLIAVPTVAPTLATMIGLGVGIDYALFLVTRHKEQLGRRAWRCANRSRRRSPSSGQRHRVRRAARW